MLLLPTEGWAIPAFSRRYGIQCGACHSAFPALNTLGEGFRLSGYRRFAGETRVPQAPSVTIRERLELQGISPFSFSTGAEHNPAAIDNTLWDRRKNAQTAPHITSPEHNFTRKGFEWLVAALLKPHLSFHRLSSSSEMEFRQFFKTTIDRQGVRLALEGLEIPELAFTGFHDIFAQDLLNLKTGLIDLPMAFSPSPRRLSFFPYLVYEVTALDVISYGKLHDFVSIPRVDAQELESNQFRLSKGQIGFQMFGRATPSLHRIAGLSIDYAVGVVNGNNIHIDNNTTKDAFGRLAFTYPVLDANLTVGGFGYYSGNTLNRLASNPEHGARYRDRLWRAGPDISLTLNTPVYMNLFSQILFGRNSNATGFGKAVTWWGGFIQAEVKPLSELIVYTRYDWINGNRFNDTNITINGISGSIGPVNPRLWDVLVGIQYFLYDNFKLIAEYRYGKKELRPDSATASQLTKAAENATFVGFRLAF